MRSVILGAALLAVAALPLQAADKTTDDHQFGLKYSPLAQINTNNVQNLQRAWEYRTGEIDTSTGAIDAFEDQPSLIGGNLLICTPARRVIALDPATGAERWVYDPKTKPTGGVKKCRGVSAWIDDLAPADATCKTRIFLGTQDYRLIAIDARNGRPCEGFGAHGEVQMELSKPELYPGEISASSPPAIVNGVVVVGSAIFDNQRQDTPSGRVLAFDARTGRQLWMFDPIPRDPSDPAMATWAKGTNGIGGANVWAEMAVDEALDLVYLPTTAPSGDFYGGARAGRNDYANSVVALKGATGEVAWHFQFTHHDIWDYDTPSRPLLIDFPSGGQMVPALVQNTKTGMIFIFDRKTGAPLIPIEERPVPQEHAVPGEVLSPTQPFPVNMPTLAPQSISADDAWGFTPIDRWLCKRRIESTETGPLYTPPSLKGTIWLPAGGPNWGGGAYDPKSQIMVVAGNRVRTIMTLVPREAGKQGGQTVNATSKMLFPSEGAPYQIQMEQFLSGLGAPCTKPPWAVLTAVDLVSGKIRWEVPLGTIERLAPVPIPWELGAPGAGSPLVTAGGLVFIGFASDDKFRAVDVLTGKTLWKAELPAAGTSVPVSYEMNGEQFVVLAAGGHGIYRTTKGDSVVAFKLKR